MSGVIKEAVFSYNNYIIVVKKELPAMIQMFRNSEDEINLKKSLIDLFEGMEWIIIMNKKLESFYENKFDVLRVNEIMRSLLEAYEFKDYYLCADILEFELLEMINELKAYEVIEKEDE